MIPIFIPLPAVRQVRAPDRGRADQRRGLVERLRRSAERVVAHGGIDPGDAGELREPGNLGARQLDRERVQDDAVVPAHVRGRERALDAALQGALGRGQAAEVANARGGAQVEPVGARGLRQHAAFGGRLRQRRRVERDHNLGSRRARGGRSGKRKRRQPAEKNKTPFQEGNGTGATLACRADVAELVDAHGSGPCGRKPVEVQVLSSASPDPATFGPATAPNDSDVTPYLLLIGIVAFCLPLVLGLIVAARQRPSRHDLTLEHIEELETELGIDESDDLNDADRAKLTPEQIEAERAHIRHPGDRL